jgi:hypothetical protein
MPNEVGFFDEKGSIKLALIVILAIAIVFGVSKLFGKNGFLNNAFNRTADGIGWGLDQVKDFSIWGWDKIEEGASNSWEWMKTLEMPNPADYKWW